MKYRVKVATLKPEYQVVCNNTALDKCNCPFMVLGQGDLDMEFTEGLKAAFEQPDSVFSMYADLAIDDHENTKRNKAGAYLRHMVIVCPLIG